MIFNPFEISHLQEALPQVLPLSWASPQLQDNIPLVLLVLFFLMADLLAWHPKGVMRHQLVWLGNTRTARTYEASAVIYSWLKPILLCQYFLFFGLSLLSITDGQMAKHLAQPNSAELLPMVISLCVPLMWGLFQQFGFKWFSYLFGLTDSCTIMNRSFLATHIVLAPLSTIIFISVLSGAFSTQTTLILLAVLFILSQIVFIFNGFKIFCSNIVSSLLIFVYLCTLEIAPLLVIYAKITG